VAPHIEVTIRDPGRRRQTERGRSESLSGARSVCNARGDALPESRNQIVALEGRALSDDDLERVADNRPGLEVEDLCILTRQVLEMRCAQRHETPQLWTPQEDTPALDAPALESEAQPPPFPPQRHLADAFALPAAAAIDGLAEAIGVTPPP
jgi:hypothetical protein